MAAMENDNLQGMDRDGLQAERARWVEIRELKRAAIIEHLPLGEPGKMKFSAAEGLLFRRREFDLAEARITSIDERLGKA
jgi:hypothetical protein